MEQEKKRKFPIIWVGALDLEALSKLDPPQPSGVKITGDGYVAIDWGGYEYLIENERIATPERLLGWIVHIG